MVDKKRAHVFISGSVQGVFFRENTKQEAGKLGVTGWVRNLQNGQVEAVFEGDKDNVQKIVEWAKRGPDSARVDELKIHQEDYIGEFKDFEVR